MNNDIDIHALETIEDLNNYKIEDFILIGYDPHPPIKARMAV